LREYDVICPGAAERILAMAERQSAHRQAMEMKVVDSQVQEVRSQRTEVRIGQTCAFVLCAMAIIGSTIIGWRGYQWACVGLGSGGLASLAAVFIIGRKMQPPQREQQRTEK